LFYLKGKNIIRISLTQKIFLAAITLMIIIFFFPNFSPAQESGSTFALIYYPGTTYLTNMTSLPAHSPISINIYKKNTYGISLPTTTKSEMTDSEGSFWTDVEVEVGDVIEIITPTETTILTVKPLSGWLDLNQKYVEGVAPPEVEIIITLGDITETFIFTDIISADSKGIFKYSFPDEVTLQPPLELWFEIEDEQGTLFAFPIIISFYDVMPSDWFYESILYLSEPYDEVLSGYPDQTFRPNDEVTRAEFAKMIVTAMELDLPLNPTSSFSDVSQGYWALTYIETAKQEGIISGYPDGTFRPNQPITRAEIAKMIAEAVGLGEATSFQPIFKDVDANFWAAYYIMSVYFHNIVSGYPDGTFKPTKVATRAEAAKMIFQMIYGSSL
jgi:hypothetical protein